MKILCTKHFKEALGQPWRRISLGKVKLRGGTETGLTLNGTNLSGLDSDTFLTSPKTTAQTYPVEFVRYGGGVQASLDLSGKNASLSTEQEFYQVLLFYYTDLYTGMENLAFIVYENLNPETLCFDGLKIISPTVIITIPEFVWKCDLDLGQQEITSFLEDPWGNQNINVGKPGETGSISKESWEFWVIENSSEELGMTWTETTWINKYGIKIY